VGLLIYYQLAKFTGFAVNPREACKVCFSIQNQNSDSVVCRVSAVELCRMQDHAFSQQRHLSLVLMLWVTGVGVFLAVQSAANPDILRWGPNASLVFVNIVIGTWQRWGLLTCFIFATQTIKIFADEIISPFITNSVMDHKEHRLQFSYCDTQLICQSYYIFSAIHGVMLVSVATSQVDMILVLIATDVAVSTYTTHVFLTHKRHSAPYHATDSCAAGENAGLL
jgi:hypothetical protein